MVRIHVLSDEIASYFKYSNCDFGPHSLKHRKKNVTVVY